MRDNSLNFCFAASCLIHVVVLFVASAALSLQSHVLKYNFLPINLVDLPRAEKETAIQEKPPVIKPPPPPKPEKAKEAKPAPKNKILESQRPAPPAATLRKEETVEPPEMKTASPERSEPAPVFSSPSKVEGGGSEAGAGKLFEKGDVAVVPGSGTAGGGGGTAVTGLGRGSGAPGLPAAPLRTNREAKPIQTVRANYPPMALRMGMESDVTLKIEVDIEGKVTKAEITKSGGAGFDEEALKAVRQSRFEPAQRDGHNIPAEFVYIYRFRLQK